MMAGGGDGSVSEVLPRGERHNSPNFYKSRLVPKYRSPFQHLRFVIALSFSKALFYSIGLVASSQTFEFSYFCLFLVGGHDDLADGPHKSAPALLGMLLFLSPFHPFVPLRPNSLC